MKSFEIYVKQAGRFQHLFKECSKEFNKAFENADLIRVGFDLFYHLFKKFGTEIIIISEIGSIKLDSEEIFEEIVSFLHCYSMKLYSNRKRKLIKELTNEKS